MEKPILFNTDMVRAILDGRKTVTRRLAKKKYGNTELKMRTDKYGTRLIEIQENIEGETFGKKPEGGSWQKLLPYIEPKPPYSVRDTMYVRETWQCLNPYSDKEYVYKATCDADFAKDIGSWLPSIHMPKVAARIWLKVTGVRVERLQDITEQQIMLEGTPYDKEIYEMPCNIINAGEAYLRGEFMRLWESTVRYPYLKKYGWNANPFVWVIEFERCDKPEQDGAE